MKQLPLRQLVPRPRLVATLLLACCTGACVSTTLTPVEVVVRDAATKEPRAGVLVIMSTSEPFHPLRIPGDYLKENRPDQVPATTDTSGIARFNLPGPGPVRFAFVLEHWGVDSLNFDENPVGDGMASMWEVLPRSLPDDKKLIAAPLYEAQVRPAAPKPN